jgi:ribose 5-phosphate isomerase B
MMTVYIGADHRGFKLKEFLKPKLKDIGYQVVDKGNTKYEPEDDFVDYVTKVTQEVKKEGRGVLICGSGVGVDIAANKINKIRAGLLFDPKQARLAREDDNINVAVLAADFIDEDKALDIIEVFLAAVYSPNERHIRRLEKIGLLEEKQCQT